MPVVDQARLPRIDLVSTALQPFQCDAGVNARRALCHDRLQLRDHPGGIAQPARNLGELDAPSWVTRGRNERVQGLAQAEVVSLRACQARLGPVHRGPQRRRTGRTVEHPLPYRVRFHHAAHAAEGDRPGVQEVRPNRRRRGRRRPPRVDRKSILVAACGVIVVRKQVRGAQTASGPGRSARHRQLEGCQRRGVVIQVESRCRRADERVRALLRRPRTFRYPPKRVARLANLSFAVEGTRARDVRCRRRWRPQGHSGAGAGWPRGGRNGGGRLRRHVDRRRIVTAEDTR